MAFIHEKSAWPSFSWDADRLIPLLGQVRHRQGVLFGSMRGLGFDLRAEACLEALTGDIVKSSAIEGQALDSSEVRSSIARRLGLDGGGLKPSSRDVEGIVEVMLDATQNYAAPLTADRLCAWHGALFPTGWSGLRKIRVGAWRGADAGPMQVISGAPGRERVHFQAPHADRLEQEMTQFLAWFESEETMDPVLKAGLAHFWFVTIHPFEDGNGRLARAIADMALARADDSPERFYSMSTQIEAERADYYEELERQQRGTLDVTPWLEWFLGCLGRALDTAETDLQGVILKARIWEKVARHPVSDRQRHVITRMLNDFKGNLTSSKYAKLADVSADTALRDIRELTHWGVLVRNPGSGRSTSYRLADP